MIITNIYEAKAKLSEFLEAAARGERVLICKRNQPVAELRAVQNARTSPRNLEPMYQGFEIGPEFLEPLSDDDLDRFEGIEPRERREPRVAARKASYRSGRKPRK